MKNQDQTTQSRQSIEETERQLQRYADRIERTEEELVTLAYIVSHDLRTPLISLKSFAAELNSALETVHPVIDALSPHLEDKQEKIINQVFQEDIPEFLDFIQYSIGQMDKLIGAILKLSRLTRKELTFEPLDTEALVQKTLSRLAPSIEKRQASVSVGPLPEIFADRGAMEQIWEHILTNAVIYLEADRPGEIEITAEKKQDKTVFHVRDNGRGIAERDMSKVFKPFRRAGRQNVPGEGMSLAYARTLIRRHGGYIECTSKLEVGTTFTFTISNHIVEGGIYAE